MIEDNEKQSEFETITLTNVWIKQNILDVITKINENEIIAYNGILISEISQIDNEQKIIFQLQSYNLMKSYLKQLLDNVTTTINRLIVLKLKLTIEFISEHEPLFIYTLFDDVRHLETHTLTREYYHTLSRLSKVKSQLLNELADKEILMPKKLSDKKEKIKYDLEDG